MNPEHVPLIDAHLHLQESSFEADLEEVIRLAVAGGVRYMLCNGSSEEDWPAVLRLARTHPEIIPCFGLHPWYVKERSGEWLANLAKFLNAVPSAVGEIGLDRWVEDRDESAQEEVFLAQLEMARCRNRPVMIHCLRAWGWFMDVMKSQPAFPAGVLFHAYSGSAELIEPLVRMGAYFSFAGTILDEKYGRARDAIIKIPRDRLLLETDAPFMPLPEPYRSPDLKMVEGKVRNEPSQLPVVVRGVAELLGISAEELSRQLWTNARRFLGGLIDENDPTEYD